MGNKNPLQTKCKRRKNRQKKNQSKITKKMAKKMARTRDKARPGATSRPERIGSLPRFDNDSKLLMRFYEPLVLLHVLDRQTEQRLPCSQVDESMDHFPRRQLQRTFLEQLAFICDHTKGGDTVTALAIEGCPSDVTFWIASNTNPKKKVIPFLQDILDLLKSASHSSMELSDQLESMISIACVEFASAKIRAYQKMLRKPLKECMKFLRQDANLLEWLSTLQGFECNQQNLCQFAYAERKCCHMKDLHTRAARLMDLGSSVSDMFFMIRHLIGRLGSYHKAAKVLVAASLKLPRLFDGFKIKARPSPELSPLPQLTDHLTTPKGILTRMLPKDDSRLVQYQEDLEFMNSMFGVHDRLLEILSRNTFRPRVHAELILLEFFHENRINFVDNDRFIACRDFVRPSSHGVRYLNWRPPSSHDIADSSDKKHQRDILNKMVVVIRQDALRQIEQRRGPSRWRPDSTTGISSSVDNKTYPPISEEKLRNIGSPSTVHTYIEDESLEFSSNSDSEDSEGGVSLSTLEA